MKSMHKCHVCKTDYLRTNKQVNQVIKRQGFWRCKKCSNAEKNKANAKPEGTIRTHKQSGYLEIKHNNKWVRYHRFLIEQHTGVKLQKHEDVHHIDENPLNNEISNLMIISHSEHTRLHNTGSKQKKSTINKIALSKMKLSREQSLSIKELSKKISQKKVSEYFGVSQMTVSRIVRNLTYREDLYGISK